MALIVAAGSAHGAVTSVNPKDIFGDPFGFNLDGQIEGGEVPGVGGDPDPADIPLDMRGHSDVPDLPDSGDDGGSGSSTNVGIFVGDVPGPGLTWEFVDSVANYSGVAPVMTLRDGPLSVGGSSGLVPSPGSLVALTGAAIAVGLRRRR